MSVIPSLVAQHYAANKTAMAPTADPSGSVIGQAVKSFAETMQDSESTAMAAMTSSVDPHVLVEALAQTQLAVETVVAVRDKVVEAYQEILRMPV